MTEQAPAGKVPGPDGEREGVVRHRKKKLNPGKGMLLRMKGPRKKNFRENIREDWGGDPEGAGEEPVEARDETMEEASEGGVTGGEVAVTDQKDTLRSISTDYSFIHRY